MELKWGRFGKRQSLNKEDVDFESAQQICVIKSVVCKWNRYRPAIQKERKEQSENDRQQQHPHQESKIDRDSGKKRTFSERRDPKIEKKEKEAQLPPSRQQTTSALTANPKRTSPILRGPITLSVTTSETSLR